MLEKVISFTLILLAASATSLAYSANLETRLHISPYYQAADGQKKSLPPVRLFVKHDSDAGIKSVDASGNCEVQVGKGDALGLFLNEEKYPCISDGSRIYVSQAVLLDLLDRSLFYSLRFSAKSEIEEVFEDLKEAGKLKKLVGKDDSTVMKALKEVLSTTLGSDTEAHSFALNSVTEFKFSKTGTSQRFEIQLEPVNTKMAR